MVKKKENCFKCGLLTDDLISFHFIDDWCQFEIKLCQDCTSKANVQGFESSEEWLCPICKKVYCCTICGDENHHTKNCTIYIPDEDDLPFYFKQLLSSFRKRTFQRYAHTPYGVIPFGEVDKPSRERSEMQTLLMNIRKKTMKKMPEIAEMIKYYFNSKYGEMGEGIVSPAKMSKKVLEQAIYKHAIYMDTDSFSLNILSIKDVLKEIINYPVNKNLIIVTGDRGIGKSSVIIALIEKWKKIDNIDCEMYYSDKLTSYIAFTETWGVYLMLRKFEFKVLLSSNHENDNIFKQTCLIINVEQRIDYNKEMKVILYWLSKRTNNTDIIMVSQAIIPFCSNEGYEQYKQTKLKMMKEWMDK